MKGGRALVREARGFLDHLTVERGASPHTVDGYRRDLFRYSEFLAARGIDDLGAVTEAEVTAFAAWLHTGDAEHAALAPSSVARALSAVSAQVWAHARGRHFPPR